jgi:hypothetical protein
MNKIMFLALLGGVACAANAQTTPAVDEVRITRPVLRIELPAERRNVWADEFEDVKGTYALSNGKSMQLSMWGNRMYAKIDGMPKTQLVAVSPYVFVALDETLKVSIDTERTVGRNEAELLMVVPRLAGTNVVNEVVRLVASR